MGEPAFRRNATIVEEHLRSGSPCNRTQQVVRVAVRAPNLPGFVVLVCNFAVRKYEIKKWCNEWECWRCVKFLILSMLLRLESNLWRRGKSWVAEACCLVKSFFWFAHTYIWGNMLAERPDVVIWPNASKCTFRSTSLHRAWDGRSVSCPLLPEWNQKIQGIRIPKG